MKWKDFMQTDYSPLSRQLVMSCQLEAICLCDRQIENVGRKCHTEFQELMKKLKPQQKFAEWVDALEYLKYWRIYILFVCL